MTTSKPSIVIVGAGPAGMQAARGLAKHYRVIVIDADEAAPTASEQRPALLPQLAGYPMVSRPLINGITCLSGCRVVAIDRRRRCVISATGERIHYSTLVLALGAEPRRPAFANVASARLLNAYQQADFTRLASFAKRKETLAILGGGPLGVELAARLAPLTTIHLLARRSPLASRLNAGVSRALKRQLEHLGVVVECDLQTNALRVREDAIYLENRTFSRLLAQRLILACGQQPRTQLAADAGLDVQEGICVDAMLRSSDDAIFALGDCAQPPAGKAAGNIAQALVQADRLAAYLLDKASTTTDNAETVRHLWVGDKQLLLAKKLHHHTEANTLAPPEHLTGKRLNGGGWSADFVGRQLVAVEALVTPSKSKRLEALFRQPSISRWQLTALRLRHIPVSRQLDPLICHCAAVSASQLSEAVARVGKDLEALGQSMGAGQYCGACREALALAVLGKEGTQPRRYVLTAVLVASLVAVLLAPALPVGASIHQLSFRAHQWLVGRFVREMSGYICLGLLLLSALALALPGHRPPAQRRNWWHLWLGILALILLPLHLVGGIWQSNLIGWALVMVSLANAVMGSLTLLGRGKRLLLKGHRLATAALLALLVLHVIFVYQY